MYTVTSDRGVLMNPMESLLLIDPILELAQNEAGSFSFSLAMDHPLYVAIRQGVKIRVDKDDEAIFYGRVCRIETDFYGTKTVSVEGELAYLSDTIQRPAEFHDMSLRSFISTLLENHNTQSEDKFELGMVNITDPNDSLYRYTNYEDTLFCLLDKVVSRFNGIVRIRHANGKRILDILDDYPRFCTQSIRFKENLMDYVCDSSTDELATVVIPLGATVDERKIEALEERVTIASINNQKDYLESAEGISKYGRIAKVVTFDDVHTPSILKARGQEWIEHKQYEDLQLEITAVDLSLLDVNIDAFQLLDRIRVQSDYHSMDEIFPLTSITIHLLQPDQNLFHLGGKPQSFTNSSKSAQVSIMKKVEAIRSPNSLLEEAKENAAQLLNNFGKYGHVVTVQDEDGQIQEICIIDTQDLETAKNVWRWNMGGLAFSSNGYTGPYKTAMTMDGTISGEMLAANSIAGEKIDISYRTSVEKNITDSLVAAKEDTDEKLKAYWTQVETESRITNAMDSISLSVFQSACDYTDNTLKTKLAQYYTKSEIDIKTDAIQLSVYQEYALPDNLLPYTADFGSTSIWKRHSNCTIGTTYVGGGKELAFKDNLSAEATILTVSGVSNPFANGHYYTFSFFMKATTNSPVTLTFATGHKLLEPVINRVTSYTSLTANQETGVITVTLKPSSSYSRCMFTFRTGAAVSGSSFNFVFKKAASTYTSNVITLSRFKLEKGRYATDYQKKMSEITTSQASILMNYDSIVATVSKKVGTSEIASYIEQNAEAVRIAWSNISEYIEFKSGSIYIYAETGKTTANRLMQMSKSGMMFWREGYEIGKIGVNSFAGETGKRGLVFDLEYDGSYMAWCSKVTRTGNYIVQMLYANINFGSYTRNHIYFACPVDFNDNIDFHWHHLKNASLQQPDIINNSSHSGFGTWDNPKHVKLPIEINSDGTVETWWSVQVSGGVIF